MTPEGITPVDEAESPGEPVSEDVAELTDANPSGHDLSATATGAVPDEDDDRKP